MNRLRLHFIVKFRAFGITFGTVERDLSTDVDLPIAVPRKVLFNDRGVFIEVYTS